MNSFNKISEKNTNDINNYLEAKESNKVNECNLEHAVNKLKKVFENSYDDQKKKYEDKNEDSNVVKKAFKEWRNFPIA